MMRTLLINLSRARGNCLPHAGDRDAATRLRKGGCDVRGSRHSMVLDASAGGEGCDHAAGGRNVPSSRHPMPDDP